MKLFKVLNTVSTFKSDKKINISSKSEGSFTIESLIRKYEEENLGNKVFYVCTEFNEDHTQSIDDASINYI